MVALVSGGALPVDEGSADSRAAASPAPRDVRGSGAINASFRAAEQSFAHAGISRKQSKQKVGKLKFEPEEACFVARDAQSVRDRPQFKHL